MRNRRVLTHALALGLVTLVATAVSPADAATKKKATTTKKKATPTTKVATATTVAAAAAAKTGGSAIMALTNETTSGWLPGDGQWGAPGGTVSSAFFDRMFNRTAAGELLPWLVESWKSSSDYKTWEFTVRSGIKFHNGEALDGAALALNLESVRTGAVTAPLFGNLASCTGSGMTATCTTKTAWVSFPEIFSGQTGAIAAPDQIKRKDRQHPIGTGAFMCKGDCWVPNQSMKLVKNPTYWKTGLPKLDAIEFRPVPDEDQRLAQLQSGQIQFMQTGNFITGRDLAGLAKEGKVKLMTSEDGNSTAYDIVNMVKKDNPLLDARLRRAWAHAIDLDTLIKVRAPGATAANGPFAKGVTGYLEESGFPQFDLDKAKALVDQYKKDKGVDTVTVVLGTDNIPDNQQTVAVMKQMADRAGFSVRIAPGQDTSAFQNTVFTAGGGLDLATWNWLPYSDPDTFGAFLGSSGCGGPAVCPLTQGRNTLNWGRVVDGQVDAAFEQIRGNSDPAVRKRAAESVNRQYGEQAYHMWRWRSRLHIAACAKCGGLEDTVGVKGEKLPQGTTAHFLGVPYLTIG